MSRAPTSLRARLFLAPGLMLSISLCLGATLVYLSVSGALLRQFDARLLDEARGVANMVEERVALPWEWEPGGFGDFDRRSEAAYFEVWLDDGTSFARSPSLGASHLPHVRGGPGGAPTRLPDGRSGRLLTTWLSPRLDDEGPQTPSGRRVLVAIARDTQELEATLTNLRLLLVLGALTGVLFSGLALRWSTRLALRPLLRLAQRIDGIDAAELATRIDVSTLPAELLPVGVKLNELLGRLQDAFLREQRFSADVSHELRTPLAALRSMLEIAASRDRAAGGYRATLVEALPVVDQMATLAERLLLLARLEGRVRGTVTTDVRIAELVDACLVARAAQAEARGLTVENRVTLTATWRTERDLLQIAITNLIDNALDYTESGGRIVIESDLDRGLLFSVSDSGPAIPGAALAQLFDRFFRADPARSGTETHHGIGLALVRAVATGLGLEASARNRADGWVVFALRVSR